MAIKVANETVSDRAWGDVDKSALGTRLAEAYANGDASKAVIREAYAFVPEEAFEDGEFHHSLAWGPHHELRGDTLVLNRGGVHAAAGALAGARAEPSLSGEQLSQARRHIRRHYTAHLDEEPPESLGESAQVRTGVRLVEQAGATGPVQLVESEAEGLKGRLRAVGITADVVNANGRRYPAAVIAGAVDELRTHLHESAGQGRLIQLLGEAEHPSSKGVLGGGQPNILETVVKWDAVTFDGRQVLIEGNVIRTAKGRDILALLEGGVIPDVSQRGYGDVVVLSEEGQDVEEVTDLHITGYDLVVAGSDPFAGVLFVESNGTDGAEHVKEREMTELNLEVLRAQYPDLVHRIEEEHDARERARLEKALEERAHLDQERRDLLQEHDTELREMLGLSETDDLKAAMAAREAQLQALQAQEQARTVAAYIGEQVATLKYADFLKDQFVEAVKAVEPKTVEEAKSVIITKRKEYDAIQAKLGLIDRGGVHIYGPVIESELGIPAFARAGWELQESLVNAGLGRRWDHRKPVGPNEIFAAQYLARYDKQYQHQLIAESRLFSEAEQTADLSLPYSVMRAVVAEAFPELVASSIFDFGTIDTSPTLLFYETFAGETGYTATVTDESITSDESAWVALDYKRVTPGTVVVTSDPAGTTYAEGTDYVIDYANGKLYTLPSPGTIGDTTALLIDYSYTAIRLGEMQPIERGKMTLASQTVTAAADRLAAHISNEAIVFSRSQIGWDATTRTLASLVRQVQRKVDQGVLYKALAAALIVAGNSAGTWDEDGSGVTLDDLVTYIGVAKVKVLNRYYQPTFVLGSATAIDKLSNWDGFKRDGFTNAELATNGFVGRIKGLACYNSTEFSDAYLLVGNRELAQHRVFQPMAIKGPYPTYDSTTGELIAADQYYIEEYNITEALVPEKGSYVILELV